MRHYSLIPVRYNEQQLLVRCEPVDAELWSIQWTTNRSEFTRQGPNSGGILMHTGDRSHWFADVAPLERDNADAIVRWLNNREQMIVSRPHNRYRYFESLDSARAFAQAVFARTGVIVCVEACRAKASP